MIIFQSSFIGYLAFTHYIDTTRNGIKNKFFSSILHTCMHKDKFGVPYDGVPEMKLVTIHTALSVIFVTLSIIGIAFTIVCLIVNFVFREKT